MLVSSSTTVHYYLEWKNTRALALVRIGEWVRVSTNPQHARTCPALEVYWQEMEAQGLSLSPARANHLGNPDGIEGAHKQRGTPFLTIKSAAWWLHLVRSYFPTAEVEIVAEETKVRTLSVYSPPGQGPRTASY